MCIEYHISVNMYHVSDQGVDERMINVHYYYFELARSVKLTAVPFAKQCRRHFDLAKLICKKREQCRLQSSVVAVLTFD